MEFGKNPFKNTDEEVVESSEKNENITKNEGINQETEGVEETVNSPQENKETTQEQITQEEVVQEETISEKNEYQEKYEDLNNKYIRLAADFDNFRKRTLQEKEELSQYACCELLKKISAVLDTFDRAQEHLKEIEDCKVVKESYEVAYKQLKDTLAKIGMEEIECLGQAFNPSEHEAITQIPTDEYEADCVACVMQKGYKVANKVIRPALVGVAVKKEQE